MTNKIIVRTKGGSGSGNFDHAGRPGEVGGRADVLGYYAKLIVKD